MNSNPYGQTTAVPAAGHLGQQQHPPIQAQDTGGQVIPEAYPQQPNTAQGNNPPPFFNPAAISTQSNQSYANQPAQQWDYSQHGATQAPAPATQPAYGFTPANPPITAGPPQQQFPPPQTAPAPSNTNAAPPPPGGPDQPPQFFNPASLGGGSARSSTRGRYGHYPQKM